MGFPSRGRRPAEYASKAAHGHLITRDVEAFLKGCELPKSVAEVAAADLAFQPFAPAKPNPIRHVIAFDGGYQEVPVRKEYPSASMCFFQFGALMFSVKDLDEIEETPFIDPADMAKLKDIERRKLVIPVRNVTLKGEPTLTHSVRRAVYEFFRQDGKDALIESLKWFLYGEYEAPDASYSLSRCPACPEKDVPLVCAAMRPDHTFTCPACSATVYLTDVLRLHEAIDNELGAGGVLGYLTTSVEQLILVHAIRMVMATRPALLKEVMFIKDGPLAFFGQTANLHKPMRRLVTYLFDRHDLYLVGLEKSGAFVDHAGEISKALGDMAGGRVMALTDEYIYRYIVPGKVDVANPYGTNTYYGTKVVFKAPDGRVYVLSVPTAAPDPKPTLAGLRNLPAILTNVAKLRCDMYDNGLLPIALANKLISLADHPSSKILEKFAKAALAAT